MRHVKLLAGLYERHVNVVAVELLNEPPLGGLDVSAALLLSVRRRLFDFTAQVSRELLAAGYTAPLAINDIGSSIEGGSRLHRPVFAALSVPGVGSISSTARQALVERAREDKLIVAYHYYSGLLAGEASFDEFASYARAFSRTFRDGEGVPLYLGEFVDGGGQPWHNQPRRLAADLARAVGVLGVSAATYWQGAVTNWTGNDGWFKYPPELYAHCIEDPGAPECAEHPHTFKEYQRTIDAGSFWAIPCVWGRG